MIKNLNSLAGKIIKANQYLTLATSSSSLPWTSPVCYAFDKNFNFYWVSLPSARHSQNISDNPHVSAAIFDSRQNWGEGVGLQIEGTATRLSLSLSEYPIALKIYFGRRYPFGKASVNFKKFLDNKTYFFYKLVPEKIWLNDPNAKVDVRVEVKLR